MMNDSAVAIHLLWCRLPQISRFTFQAGNGEGSQTDWNGSCEGEVLVAPWQDGWSFDERGHYLTPRGQRIAMHNRYGWQRSEHGIVLYHLRHTEPVHLLELRPVSPQRWQTDEPHLCGADHYQAVLEVVGSGFDMQWQIRGSRKNERLAYRYR